MPPQIRQRDAAVPMRGHRLDQQVRDVATEILVDFYAEQAVGSLLLWTSITDRVRVKIGAGSYSVVGATRATGVSLGPFNAGETKQGTIEVEVPLGADTRREELELNLGYGVDAVAQQYDIGGTILDGDGAPLPGVTVDLTGDATDSDITDGNGEYSFEDLWDGDYTVTPSKSATLSAWVFDPVDDDITIAGGNEVSDFAARLFLTTPLTLDFEGLSLGTAPSWVKGTTGYVAPTIVSVSVEGLTRALNFQQGSGGSVGYGSIDLAAGLGATAGAEVNVAADGLRMQILEKRSSGTARQVSMFEEIDDNGVAAPQQRIYIRDAEENSPDNLRLMLEKDGVQKNLQTDQTGINNSTGNQFRYARCEITLDTGMTFDIYSTAGAHQGTQHTMGWPTDGVVPLFQKYLHGLAGAGFTWDWVEIWIGKLSDTWPSM